MKKPIVIFVTILIFTITACHVGEKKVVEAKLTKNLQDKTLQAKTNTAPPIDVISNKDQEIELEMNAFSQLITPEATTADLKAYIDENLEYLNPHEIEEALEFILIYQTETMDDFIITEEIYNEQYKDLNQSLIDKISNEQIKAQYKLLLDSFLRIEFDEDYSYVTTDWQAIKKLSPYLPAAYEELIDLYIKNDKAEYYGEQVDVKARGQEIIKVEKMVKNSDSLLFNKLANELYQTLLYQLFIGPEGSHEYFWWDKNSEKYKDLIKLSQQYSDSLFSSIINDIAQVGMEEVYTPDLINKYLTFGLDSGKRIETLYYNQDEGIYRIFQVEIPDNQGLEKSINQMITSEIANCIEENAYGDFYISTDLKYADDQYISYEIFLDYSDMEGNVENKYFYKTLDYLQGKYINLEEYLGASFDSIKHELEKYLGQELEACPDFILFANDISVLSYNQEGDAQYIGSLNLKDIYHLKN